MSLSNRTTAIPLTLLLWALVGCHGPKQGLQREPSSGQGPDQYSALVVRTIISNGSQQVEQTRVVVSGALTREEWMEDGVRRALIMRPDLGMTYVLSMDKRTYTDASTGADSNAVSSAAKAASSSKLAQPEPPPAGATSPNDQAGPSQRSVQNGESADWPVEDAAQASRTENHRLPDQVIDTHRCEVTEQVCYFPDGHIERIKTYRAPDLEGLALRVESQSETGADTWQVITERRDVRLDVAADEFSVPSDFKRQSR